MINRSRTTQQIKDELEIDPVGRLRVCLLGGLRILHGTRSLSPEHIRLHKARDLLKLLALAPAHRLHREQLLEMLWPEHNPRAAAHNLNQVLYVLRPQLVELDPSARIQIEDECLVFSADGGVSTDVEDFEQLARSALSWTDALDSEMAAACQTAILAYTGDLLPEDGPSDLFYQRRDELRQLYLYLLLRLGKYHLEQGEYLQDIDLMQRAISLDSVHEEVHCELMRAYALSGQRPAALRQYQVLAEALRCELDVAPQAETTQLYQAIRDQAEIPEAKEMVLRVRSHPGQNLPEHLIPFLGRKKELSEIAKLLADPQMRLLTILGAGGMGKTRLALEAARQQIGKYAHGVFYISLASLDSAHAIMPAIADTLGYSFHPGSQPKQQLLDYLRKKQVLLLLDNFEHLMSGVEMVLDILLAAPQVKLLITSRIPLQLEGEVRFQLEGMDLPPSISRDIQSREKALEYDSVQFFLQCAQRLKHDFELAGEDIAKVVHICRLVGGMPLGIRLAAAWLENLSPAKIALEIERNLGFLESEEHDTPVRQRSMRAAFAHSWSLLSERQQKLLATLSVFRGGFSQEAAQEIAGASLGELKTLIGYSLIQRWEEERYSMLELLRQFAAEHLQEDSVLFETANNMHCVYFSNFLNERQDRIWGREQQYVMKELLVESANIRVSWYWAIDRLLIDEMGHSLQCFAFFYSATGLQKEGLDALACAASKLANSSEFNDFGEGDINHKYRTLYGRILIRQAQYLYSFLEDKEAVRLLRISRKLLKHTKYRLDLAFIDFFLGQYGNFSDQKREKHLKRALAVLTELNYLDGVGWTYCRLSDLALKNDEWCKAKDLLQKAIDIARDLGHIFLLTGCNISMGELLIHSGDYAAAKNILQENVKLIRRFKLNYNVASTYIYLGYIAFCSGDYRKAKIYYQKAAAICRDFGFAEYEADKAGCCIELYLREKEYEKAVQYAREGIDFFRKYDLDYRRSSIYYALKGQASCGLKQLDEARVCFSQALEQALRGDLIEQLAFVMASASVLFIVQGEKERALGLLALVLQHPRVSRPTKDKAETLAAGLREGLAPQDVADVEKSSHRSDLRETAHELLTELEDYKSE